MRIFLIPLSQTTKTFHCHSTLQPTATSYLNRATTFAGKKWEELGKAPPDGMKYRLYGAGTRMLEKIEHDEVFLKAVPAKEDVTIATKVPFMYPASVKEAQIQQEIEQFLAHRIPYHRKYMIYSALLVPVTSLFTIVPLVPNIPFFYNAFRLWSHWKAYSGAKHLDFLVKNGTMRFEPSEVLDLGLRHDPQFAVFFNGSYQLSTTRRSVWQKKAQEVDEVILAESSGEITPAFLNGHSKTHNGSSLRPTSTSISSDSASSTMGSSESSPGSAAAATSLKATPVTADDPLSMTDHVAIEGFLSDAEIQTISIEFNRPPMMSREIQRARYQEAEKFVKRFLVQNKSQVEQHGTAKTSPSSSISPRPKEE
ncbi:hypothetical protein BGZ83_010717 [Gryganskiella cystojenkinii]|nr:hypothetical protein BGZ83_010717 [Gryganskiella cystojenkinii]